MSSYEHWASVTLLYSVHPPHSNIVHKPKPDLQYEDWRSSPSLHWTSRTPAFARPQSKDYSCQTSNTTRSKISITYFRFGLANPRRIFKEEAALIATTYFTISYVCLFAASSYHNNLPEPQSKHTVPIIYLTSSADSSFDPTPPLGG